MILYLRFASNNWRNRVDTNMSEVSMYSEIDMQYTLRYLATLSNRLIFNTIIELVNTSYQL